MSRVNGQWYPPSAIQIGERTYDVFPSLCKSEGKQQIRLRQDGWSADSKEDAKHLIMNQKDIPLEFRENAFFTFAGWSHGSPGHYACADYRGKWTLDFYEITELVAGEFPQVVDVWRTSRSGGKITAERR